MKIMNRITEKYCLDNDIAYRAGNTNNLIEFEQNDDDQDDDQETKRPSISYSEAVMISDDESDASLEIDDL